MVFTCKPKLIWCMLKSFQLNSERILGSVPSEVPAIFQLSSSALKPQPSVISTFSFFYAGAAADWIWEEKRMGIKIKTAAMAAG